jgi:predicted metal-binding protein
VLSICERCEQSKSSTGERLHDEVKRLRREQGLKELFKVEKIRCLKCCDRPCAIELSGKKRSTYTRVDVRVEDAAAVVDACVRYVALEPGEELPERLLPGETD